MVIILTLYIALVWLLFFKFKWLPWNKLTQWLCLIVGVVILSGFNCRDRAAGKWPDHTYQH